MELRLDLPTKTTDLSGKQLQLVSWLFLQGYSETEFLLKAFMHLSGLRLITDRDPEADGARWYKHRSLKRPFVLDSELLAEMSKRCGFLLKPDEFHPLPWIRKARARHFRLYNASFEEYLMAENFYLAYVETKADEHLDNLIACLYRPIWQRWNASKIQQRAKRFRSADPAIKNTVFMWYVGFRTYVPKRCKTLFTPGKKSKRPFHPREYINGMIHQLNNGDITIKDKLMKQPAWDALDELEQRAIDHELAMENK
ncbi:hypothetical protein [uncultured Sunxiuqinia sp.]|uniref:hypothetical protein n=1 Tax=uncultured Sunxiuqinia sp. TaxID=1573825 RepID=UPI0026128C45|nr:hypothetical protein [uncultured Sunxiuqinia sp.]